MNAKLKLVVGTKISYLEDQHSSCTITSIKANKVFFSDGGETYIDFMNKALKDNNCYHKINDVNANQINELYL